MTSWRVVFEPKRQHRLPAWTPTVHAQTPAEAISLASALLRGCGENLSHYKTPTVREVTEEIA